MTADEALARILAMRWVTEQTGFITKRSQNEILASLPSDVLAEVSLRLKQHITEKMNERTYRFR